MLARPNRVTAGEDFRRVVRRGRRVTSPTSIVYVAERSSTDPARFGFVIARPVGNAVHRNRLRRRLRSVARELVDQGVSGVDVVVRARPGAAEIPWDAVRDGLRAALADRMAV